MRTITVRTGGRIATKDAEEARTVVRNTKRDDGSQVVRLCLEWGDRTEVYDSYHVSPPEAYGDDFAAVELSALSCACHSAAHLESLEDWQLSAHLLLRKPIGA